MSGRVEGAYSMAMKHPHYHLTLAFTAATAAMCSLGSPLQGSETDERIATSFETSYVFKTYLAEDSVTTKVKDGVVTLSGTVADEAHKSLAQETAAGLPGVLRVDNQLATKGEVAAERSDGWIARRVRLALLFHRNVSARKISVEVKDGIVTLKGETSSQAKKELTIEYAKDIDGVREVKDAMTVMATPAPAERSAGELVDDASIIALVKAALVTHRSTSAIKTGVETRTGVVTITGIAKNAAEKSLVTKLVGDTNGVTDVKNLMTIDEVKTT